MNWTPIRKVVVFAVAAVVTAVARKVLHVDLGPDVVNSVVDTAVGAGAAWAVKDPRVATAEHAIEDVVRRAEA